jgi:hypothetical protein
MVVNRIGATTGRKGVQVHAWLEKIEYPKAPPVTGKQCLDPQIKRNTFNGEWTYTGTLNRGSKIQNLIR